MDYSPATCERIIFLLMPNYISCFTFTLSFPICFKSHSIHPERLHCLQESLKAELHKDTLESLCHLSFKLNIFYLFTQILKVLQHILYKRKTASKINLKTAVLVDSEWKWINQIRSTLLILMLWFSEITEMIFKFPTQTASHPGNNHICCLK